MKKINIIILFFFLVVIIVFTLLYTLNRTIDNQPASMILYYGNICPHCKIVDDFIKEGNLDLKLNIQKKEVYDNSQNALELQNTAKSCKLNQDNMGVPLLYYNKTCYIGDQEIIKVFNNLLSGD